MSVKFRAITTAGEDSKCAVIEGDDAVLYDPFYDLSRVRFHSDFLYPSITEVVTGTLNLPAIGANSQRYNTYTLYEHGVDGHPFVTGRILDHPTSGVSVALEGSVPVFGHPIYGFARWLTLGSDETNVLLHEQTITREAGGMSAATLDYVLYISDLTVEGYDGSPPGGAVLQITPNRVTLGEGKFDTDKLYLKAVEEEGKDTNFVGGRTLAMAGDPGNAGALAFEFSNGEYTYRNTKRNNGANILNINFTANSIPIKL